MSSTKEINASTAAAAAASPDPESPRPQNTGMEQVRGAPEEQGGLDKTVQTFYKQLQRQTAQIEAYEGLLKELCRREGEEEEDGEWGWQEPPNLWGEDNNDGAAGEGKQQDQAEGMRPPTPSSHLPSPAATLPRSPSVCSAVASARLTAQIIEVIHPLIQ